MIKTAFKTEWWQGVEVVPEDAKEPKAHKQRKKKMAKSGGLTKMSNSVLGPDLDTDSRYSQMEENFSLYFGLAVQLYEATLVSDDTPFDRFADGKKDALNKEQKEGLDLFFGKAKCANCHGGPELTKATVGHIKKERLERMAMGDGGMAVYDNGFYNIGVRPSFEDLGLGVDDPFGYPLSESRVARIYGKDGFKALIGRDPNLSVGQQERVAADGAFKTPGLRNIELTAPYFHNGGTRTLLEVVEFYNRGGDFHDKNIQDLDPDVERLHLSQKEKEALVAFLHSLTDERVRYDRAPFDHPQFFIPNGHIGNENTVSNEGTGRAKDILIEVPAVGAKGGAARPNFLE
ncbi:MAG TPA: hypothetical protein DIT13_09930 [Verrucomicrobiales bacterium]|nr:hypothetical protein [Verrucomicrobiales bacterium]HRJ07073.1 c-type cytochrome [Prosthecobacter sp.]HRK13159.1 c-type cytochrome [Prosthecobacter sp.]